jgi:hypothetical protein
MQSLFPNRPTSNQNVLVSFPAGKCNLSTVGVNGKIKVRLSARYLHSVLFLYLELTRLYSFDNID